MPQMHFKASTLCMKRIAAPSYSGNAHLVHLSAGNRLSLIVLLAGLEYKLHFKNAPSQVFFIILYQLYFSLMSKIITKAL